MHEELPKVVMSSASEGGAFWGAALKDGQWVGENTLGKMWMKLREELKEKNRPAPA